MIKTLIFKIVVILLMETSIVRNLYEQQHTDAMLVACVIVCVGVIPRFSSFINPMRCLLDLQVLVKSSWITQFFFCYLRFAHFFRRVRMRQRQYVGASSLLLWVPPLPETASRMDYPSLSHTFTAFLLLLLLFVSCI